MALLAQEMLMEAWMSGASDMNAIGATAAAVGVGVSVAGVNGGVVGSGAGGCAAAAAQLPAVWRGSTSHMGLTPGGLGDVWTGSAVAAGGRVGAMSALPNTQHHITPLHQSVEAYYRDDCNSILEGW
jgi:hypothetical protein